MKELPRQMLNRVTLRKAQAPPPKALSKLYFTLPMKTAVGGGDRRVQGPVPTDHAHARGVRPGEEYGEEDEGPAAERAREEEGKAQPQRQFRNAGDHRVDDA